MIFQQYSIFLVWNVPESSSSENNISSPLAWIGLIIWILFGANRSLRDISLVLVRREAVIAQLKIESSVVTFTSLTQITAIARIRYEKNISCPSVSPDFSILRIRLKCHDWAQINYKHDARLTLPQWHTFYCLQLFH